MNSPRPVETVASEAQSAGHKGRPRSTDRPPGYTRDQLLKSAAEVFADRGFDNASIKAIAARAGVTSATIYRHFESKADLMLGVVEQAIHAVPLAERLDSQDVSAPADFANMVSLYAGSELDNVRRLAIEIHAAASRDPDAAAVLRAYNEKIHGALSAKLAACAAAGQLPAEFDADKAASLLLTLIMGLAHMETLHPDLIGDKSWVRFLDTAIGNLLKPGPKT